MLFTGREGMGKNCARGLELVYGPRPRAVLKTKGTVFSHTDRPSPVLKITCLLFSCGKLVLQITNGFTQLLSLNWPTRRLLTICKNLGNERVIQTVDKERCIKKTYSFRTNLC